MPDSKNKTVSTIKPGLMSRRQFIQLLSVLSAGGSVSTVDARMITGETATSPASSVLGKADKDVYKNLQDPWLTLAAVQEHLLPADDVSQTSSSASSPASSSATSPATSPGASDISALRYLRNTLDAPDTDAARKDFMLQGVSWLNDLSKSTHQQVFIQLNTAQKETILRKIENSKAGSRWLSLMMSYLIEALLSDPVYGGNKNAAGWQWLEHIPGFPTPSVDQVYYKLSSKHTVNTRRRTKS